MGQKMNLMTKKSSHSCKLYLLRFDNGSTISDEKFQFRLISDYMLEEELAKFRTANSREPSAEELKGQIFHKVVHPHYS